MLQKRYVHGPGLDEPLVEYAGSGTTNRSYLLADERGSVIGVINTAGTVTVNKYDEYGAPATTNQGRFQYTGQMWLSEVWLYHYKARAYDPRLGRFLQPDPIGYAGGMNLYGYAGNDPINRRDPFGLLDCPEGPSIDNVSCQPAPEEITVTDKRWWWCDEECRRRHEEQWAEFLNQMTIQDLIDSLNQMMNAANAATVANVHDALLAGAAAQNQQPEIESPRQECLGDTYGISYDLAWDLSPLSVTTIFVDGVTEYLEAEISSQGNRNLYGNDRQFVTGRRQVRSLSQFRIFNGAMAVAGAGATGYILGANIYCTVQ